GALRRGEPAAETQERPCRRRDRRVPDGRTGAEGRGGGRARAARPRRDRLPLGGDQPPGLLRRRRPLRPLVEPDAARAARGARRPLRPAEPRGAGVADLRREQPRGRRGPRRDPSEGRADPEGARRPGPRPGRRPLHHRGADAGGHAPARAVHRPGRALLLRPARGGPRPRRLLDEPRREDEAQPHGLRPAAPEARGGAPGMGADADRPRGPARRAALRDACHGAPQRRGRTAPARGPGAARRAPAGAPGAAGRRGARGDDPDRLRAAAGARSPLRAPQSPARGRARRGPARTRPRRRRGGRRRRRLRVRHQLTTVRDRNSRVLLVEEALPVALVGRANPVPVVGPQVREWLEAPAASDLAEAARRRVLEEALAALDTMDPVLERFAHERAQTLLEDHRRVREAGGGRGRYEVRPLMPVDVIAAYVLLPTV